MTEVRWARDADERVLRVIDSATWSPHVTPSPRPLPGEPFLQPGRAPDDVLVAVEGGEVVGYIILRPAFPLEASRHVQEINGLAVDPSHRRKGIAREMIRAAAYQARMRGARRLTLRVLSTNAGALALYESCGFEIEGVLREEFLIEGRYVDDVLMAIDLTSEQPEDGRRKER